MLHLHGLNDCGRDVHVSDLREAILHSRLGFSEHQWNIPTSESYLHFSHTAPTYESYLHIVAIYKQLF